MMAERIQKVLARAGYGSRRLIESWIKEGKLHVNGVPATLGDQIKEGDRLTLEGRPLSAKRIWQQTAPQVLLYHKASRSRRKNVYNKMREHFVQLHSDR